MHTSNGNTNLSRIGHFLMCETSASHFHALFSQWHSSISESFVCLLDFLLAFLLPRESPRRVTYKGHITLIKASKFAFLEQYFLNSFIKEGYNTTFFRLQRLLNSTDICHKAFLINCYSSHSNST